MEPLAVLVKSYAGDIDIARRLFESISRFNVDKLPVFVVVPRSDRQDFTPLLPANAVTLEEESFGEHLVAEGFAGMSSGYVNQQIVKLAFWESGLAENYLCIDSDVEFIREFRRSDFMAEDGYPYSVLHQDKELLAEPRYFHDQWQSREAAVTAIAQEVGFTGPWPAPTCHANTVFNADVLASFKRNLLAPRGWSYESALRVAPYEFSWYNLWLQVCDAIPVRPCEPWVRMFHHEDQHLAFLSSGASMDDLRRAYLGVSIQSNFSRHLDLPEADSSKAGILARYLSYEELAAVARAKVADTTRRRFRPGR